jgi:hypothetical protein
VREDHKEEGEGVFVRNMSVDYQDKITNKTPFFPLCVFVFFVIFV